jgi:hypothetical protein
MSVTDTVPTEDDTLTTGPDDGFNLEAFDIRVKAGRYDGNLIQMAGMLYDRGIAENSRRWRCTFRDVAYTEEDLDATVAGYAEEYDGRGWGILNVVIGDNVRLAIKPALAILYGICRGELGMDHKAARRALKLTHSEVMACFDWYEVPSPGKDERPA